MTQMSATAWIYDFADYQQIYGLTQTDCKKKILDFPGLVSSFNAEALKRDMDVISAGPMYQYAESEMRAHVDRFVSKQIQKLQNDASHLQSPEVKDQVIAHWEKTASDFIADYANGKATGRYLPINIAEIPFREHEFDLVLCSHLLFHKALPAHISPIDLLRKLCRIGQEVRLYPMIDRYGNIMDDLGPLMLTLQQEDYGVEVREVVYQYQKGGNAMLRIWAQACHF